MRIDVHNHAAPQLAIELLREDPAYEVEIVDHVMRSRTHVPFPLTPPFVDPHAKLAELDDHELDAAVVSLAPAMFFYEADGAAAERLCTAVNEGLAEFCSASPDRLRWMAHLPLNAPQRAADHAREAAELGCVGIEVGTSIAGGRLDEPKYEPFWEAAESLGLPVMLHPAYDQPYPGIEDFYLRNVIVYPLETTVAAERLICAGVLDRHPGLRIVLVHAGGYFPYQAGRLRHARSVRPELESAPENPWSYLGRIVIDTITHDRDALRYAVSRVGMENVLLGSDLPFDMAAPAPVAAVEQAVGAEDTRAIAEENPARLYRFRSEGGEPWPSSLGRQTTTS
jgi:aminocarboxymuconate-semialdehyde decarboxylase